MFLTAEIQTDPSQFTSLAQWLGWQESLHVSDIELGLERCRRVAEKIGLAKPAPNVVTVAGTNGKGSSVAMLASIWSAAGYRTGTYTSPHLRYYNERICINGVPVSDADICAAFSRVELARGDIPLTYFEFGTLAALIVLTKPRSSSLLKMNGFNSSSAIFFGRPHRWRRSPGPTTMTERPE